MSKIFKNTKVTDLKKFFLSGNIHFLCNTKVRQYLINLEGGINIMVTKEMLIGQIVEKGDKYIEVLLNAGMHCLGCPASAAESLEEACAVHGIDVDSVVEELNKIEE